MDVLTLVPVKYLLIREKLNLNLNLLKGRALLTLVPAEQIL
jgi:hypothetical protein